MRMSATIAFASMAMMLLAACDTTSTFPYQPSTRNVMAFQGALKPNGTSVSLDAFTAAPSVGEKPNCRLAGPVDVAPGKTLEAYVQDAMQQELFMAGVYSQASPIVIHGRLEAVKMSTFGTGSWTLALTVTSTRDPVGYRVQTVHQFSSSFSAVSACKNAADAFVPTVQDLIDAVVTDPGFAKLTGR